MYVKISGLALLLSIVAGLTFADPLGAQKVQLNQQIKPLECTYTSTNTGSGVVMTSTCPNEPVPMVTSVDVSAGRPIIRGYFKASATKMLRVWVGGQWYTLGSDVHLSAIGDMWTLDLAGSSASFPPGDYVVTVDVEASDGLSIRNSYAWTFTVQLKYSGDTTTSQPPFVMQQPSEIETPPDISVVLPLDNEPTNKPIANTPSPSPVTIDSSETNKQQPSNITLLVIAVTIIVVGLAVVQVMAILRRPRL